MNTMVHFLGLVLCVLVLAGCPTADFTFDSRTELLSVKFNFPQDPRVTLPKIFPGINSSSDITSLGVEYLDSAGASLGWEMLQSSFSGWPMSGTFDSRSHLLFDYPEIKIRPVAVKFLGYSQAKGGDPEPQYQVYPADMHYWLGSLDGVLLGNNGFAADLLGWNLVLPLDPPSTLKRLSHIQADAAEHMQIVGNLAYVSCAYGGLMIFDISNPVKPTYVGGFYDGVDNYDIRRYVNSLAVSGQYAYLGCFDTLKVLDVSNPANPVLVSTLRSYTIEGYSDLVVLGNYVIFVIADNVTTNTTQVIDVSNPYQPRAVAYWPHADHVSTGGNYLYFSKGSDGLTIVDATRLPNYLLVGSYCDGDLIFSCQALGNRLYASGGMDGLKVLDVTNSASPRLLGEYRQGLSGYDVLDEFDVRGSQVYIAHWNWGLEVLDVSNPTAIVRTDCYHDSQQAYSARLSAGSVVYLLSGSNGIKAIALP